MKKTDNFRYANGNDIRSVALGTIAFFSLLKWKNSCGKHLEDNSHGHIVSLMYTLILSAEDTDDLSNGFDRDRERRRDELTNNKNIEGNYYLRIVLKDIFGSVEAQKNNTQPRL